MINLSSLIHTWQIDIDGTIVKHNGHRNNNEQLLPGVKEFWNKIPQEDEIILLSARKEAEISGTIEFIKNQGLRFSRIIFGLPTGERILINDIKPLEKLKTAIAINVARDEGLSAIEIQRSDGG